MTIYLDVLLLSNLWADYALLRTAAALTHTPVRSPRCIAAAMLGAASALTVFLPPVPLTVCIPARILLALLLCGIAFGFRNIRQLFRRTAVFFAVSILFCGAVFLLASLRTPAGWYTRNTVIYADVSLLTLLLGTSAAAAAAAFWERRASVRRNRACRLHLRIAGGDYLLPALADSGNTLRDAFSGKPVVICGREALSGWLSQFPDTAAAAASGRGFRMIPVHTVTGNRLLPALIPEYAAICPADSASEQPIDILLAITEQPDTPAVIPACCF